MKADLFLNEIQKAGISTIAGVPDSTLKQLCDALLIRNAETLKHYVTANEGAAVGLATGSYLATGRPGCVYLQNSGLGNIINPLASIANKEVYGIPMLFLVGWRGEPGQKDEPQHVYQGKVTCELLEIMSVPYSVIDKNTTLEELQSIMCKAEMCFSGNMQYAIIIKKGTFETEETFHWENGYSLVREEALQVVLEAVYKEAYIVSTTGKISRELYEQSERLFGNHERIFMTVGGMGHASMIAYGLAQADTSKRIVCIDGDGAMLMHMGSLAFIANQIPGNLLHIVINNASHESVGAMPTSYSGGTYAEIAKACGYQRVYHVETIEELQNALCDVKDKRVLTFVEVKVSLISRKELGRPKETAFQNREHFMQIYRAVK